MHCDLKPENLLLESKEPDAKLKIIDMGLGQYFNQQEFLFRLKGSLYYMAPEQLNKKYNHKVDIWACGVIFYILVTGELPFYAKKELKKGVFVDDQETLKIMIQKGKDKLNHPNFETMHKEVRPLIKSMLSLDPDDRPEAHEILENDWFKHTSENAYRATGEDSARV